MLCNQNTQQMTPRDKIYGCLVLESESLNKTMTSNYSKHICIVSRSLIVILSELCQVDYIGSISFSSLWNTMIKPDHARVPYMQSIV